MSTSIRRLTALAAAGLLALGGGAGLTAPPAAAAPPGYSVTGLDVSAFQGTIDWAAVATSGARFAYIRASEQAGTPDATFAANYAGAKANGLYAGAYHRARPDVSGGKAQADFFADNAQFTADGRTLPLMLDIEWPRANWTGLDACYNLTPSQLVSWIRAFVDEIALRTGRLALIYTNTNWWNPCTANDTSFSANQVFVARYQPSPLPLPAGWSTWSLWQYTSTGRVPGITGDVDLDVFNGDLAALAQLAGGTPNPPLASLLAEVNTRFVSAESAGTQPLIANRTAVGQWEQFTVVDAGGGFVALLARANGKYVTAESAGAKPLIANRAAIGAWEKFRIVGNTDGSVSLLANANNKYVTAESAGTKPLIANRTAIGLWERFYRIAPPVTMSLRAAANQRYVTTQSANGLPLIANRASIGQWEQFTVIEAGGGFVALLARANGKYVTAENAGASALAANRAAIGPWEKFRIVSNTDGSISLLANADNKYVTADGGTQPLIANQAANGTAERFAIVTY
ncbi:GH25 family lysozyme [Hamadaea tsunoensis]|uniref:GH25 family lysozyme n=1 Tax=Hamadaea tsunoensis TaxID=53368 RepID=UPI000688A458|nr:GH25 family lysozyme [Hamadaea tsunoensis]